MSESNKKSLLISYRRADSPYTVKLIYERLKAALPRWRIFYDHKSIEFGEDFPDRLRLEVTRADVVLVIIGEAISGLVMEYVKGVLITEYCDAKKREMIKLPRGSKENK